MGIIDSVGNFNSGDTFKNGVREMMIARPPDNGDLVWKHPDRTIPMFAQVTVNADEWGVFSKEGRPVGTLDAGRSTLSTQNIPFLSNFIDQYTGGNLFTTDLFFVKRTPYPKKFGGSLGIPRNHGTRGMFIEFGQTKSRCRYGGVLPFNAGGM